MGADQSFLSAQVCSLQHQPVFRHHQGRFVAQQPLKLHLKEKAFSFSGDDFGIVDAITGAQWFVIKGKTFSLRDQKMMYDCTGAPVFTMRQKNMFSYTQEIICAVENRPIYEIRLKFTFLKGKLYADIPTQSGVVNLVLKCDIGTRAGVICIGEPKAGGPVVAKIYRPEYTVRNHFANAQDYYVDIAVGMDAAIIVAMCVALDEARQEN